LNNFGKNLTLWLIIGLVMLVFFNVFQSNFETGTHQKMSFSDFMDNVEAGKISDVSIRETGENGIIITGHSGGTESFKVQAPTYPNLVEKLRQHKVKILALPATTGVDSFWNILLYLLPTVMIVGVFLYMMKQANGSGGRGGAMGFGRSRAKLLTEKNEKITFDDVAGIEEAKEELEEIVDYLKDPAKFQRLGGKIPKGCLLVGSPGTGKTLLARAIAGEAGVPFFTISGSDFVEMFVGVGASRVRDMFEQGKKNAPCIIFIDEIDAVGRHRGSGAAGGGNDEREQTLNQLLVEMDGFEANEGVIIIAATNRPDVLDKALLRPGRFDRQIHVPNPDIAGREKILTVHLKKVPTAPDVVARTIARGTPGFSGADLANLVNEAALLAARRGKRVVTMAEMEAAKDKVMMGVERKTMVMSEKERKLTAYHESGHAIVALHVPYSDPIHKATIIPRGGALGMVMRLPESDKFSESRQEMLANIEVSLGGRIAEELTFGYDNVTSGASSDIQNASRIARAMVKRWGMSEKLGPIYYGEDASSASFFGSELNYSAQTSALIDEEVRRILETAYKNATAILTNHQADLITLAEALLEYETLTGDEINTLLKDGKIARPSTESAMPKVKTSSLPSRRKTTEETTSAE
jgi:cell division protease FtsH